MPELPCGLKLCHQKSLKHLRKNGRLVINKIISLKHASLNCIIILNQYISRFF